MDSGHTSHQSDPQASPSAPKHSATLSIMALGLIPVIGFGVLLFFIYTGFSSLETTARDANRLSVQEAHYVNFRGILTDFERQTKAVDLSPVTLTQLLTTFSHLKASGGKAKAFLNIHYPELVNQILILQKQVLVLKELWEKQVVMRQQGETLDDSLAWVEKQMTEQKTSILATVQSLTEQANKARQYQKQLAHEKLQDIHDLKYKQLLWLLMIAGSSLAVFVIAGLMIAKRVSAPISHILTNIESMNRGDLTDAIEGINRTDDLGDIARLLAAFRQNAQNIHTLQKQLKETIARTHQSTRMKEDVLLTMSQDMKKPLKSIVGFSKTIQGDLKIAQETGKIDFPKLSNQLGTLQSTGKGMVSLVESVIDLTSDIESEQIEPTTFNVREEVQKMLPQVEVTILQQQNKFRVNCPDASLVMHSHAHKIMKCLSRLITNSAVATTAGMITLEISKSKLGEYDAIQFSISDNGVGLDHQRLTDLNNTNQQDDLDVYSMDIIKDKSGQTSGAGLGLVLVKKITKDLFGMIKAERNESAGTKITVTLPADHTMAAERHNNMSLSSLADAV